MSRERVNEICRTFPGAEVSDPWGDGHDAWKVGGKMFACMGAATSGVSVKTDSVEMAEMLIEAGVGRRAPYFHRSWINLSTESPEDELRHRDYGVVPHRAQWTEQEGPGRPETLRVTCRKFVISFNPGTGFQSVRFRRQGAVHEEACVAGYSCPTRSRKTSFCIGCTAVFNDTQPDLTSGTSRHD